YFAHLEFLFSPTRIIVGGGVSKKHRKFLPLLDLKCEIVPAKLRNEAGIVGAAVLAHREEKALLKAARKAEKKGEHKERAKREAAKQPRADPAAPRSGRGRTSRPVSRVL